MAGGCHLSAPEAAAARVRQGGVGNCWFVCALSCLAEYPHVLKSAILTPELNPAGAYQVPCYVVHHILHYVTEEGGLNKTDRQTEKRMA